MIASNVVGRSRVLGRWIEDQLEKHPVRCLAGVYVVCVVAFLVAIPLPRIDGNLVGSDGAFYYAYLPTLLIDHDLDFTNQYDVLIPKGKDRSRTDAGTARLRNRYSIGPAILWMPFFLIGHAAAVLLWKAGFQVVPDGLGYIYQVPTLLGSLTYGFGGILLIYRSCRRFFVASASASAALLIWLATNLIYYMIAEPSMSHTSSVFAVALFCELWLRFRPVSSMHHWILLGMCIGLAATIRPQDAVWMGLPLLDSLLAAGEGSQRLPARLIVGLIAYFAAAVAVLSPQMAVWHAVNGSFIRPGYLTSGVSFNWTRPEILGVLFSLRHGLFLWHPILLVAAAGLVRMYAKNRRIALLAGLGFAAQVYLVGTWFWWWGADSFGGRLLISSFPFLALGLAAAMDWAMARGVRRCLWICSACLVGWNALFFIQFRFGFISRSAAITMHELTLGKVWMLKQIVEKLLQ